MKSDFWQSSRKHHQPSLGLSFLSWRWEHPVGTRGSSPLLLRPSLSLPQHIQDLSSSSSPLSCIQRERVAKLFVVSEEDRCILTGCTNSHYVQKENADCLGALYEHKEEAELVNLKYKEQ